MYNNYHHLVGVIGTMPKFFTFAFEEDREGRKKRTEEKRKEEQKRRKTLKGHAWNFNRACLGGKVEQRAESNRKNTTPPV